MTTLTRAVNFTGSPQRARDWQKLPCPCGDCGIFLAPVVLGKVTMMHIQNASKRDLSARVTPHGWLYTCFLLLTCSLWGVWSSWFIKSPRSLDLTSPTSLLRGLTQVHENYPGGNCFCHLYSILIETSLFSPDRMVLPSTGSCCSTFVPQTFSFYIPPTSISPRHFHAYGLYMSCSIVLWF